jgi:serine/threonine-protein kinase
VSEEVIAGRYELLELVGRGGMSTVWKAQDRLLDRTVAIKVLHEQFTQDEEYVERFRREARSVAQLSHPNIVTVIDRGEDGGQQYIVFEYVAGRNLKQLIERQGPLPIRDALLLALQMARALGFAHDRGLIHRDVKPQNVLLNEDGQAKMTDFGIARSVDVDGVTITGTVLGTSEYIAPEQARGQRVDALTDVYSLGVVLYELLTGGVPFHGENFVAVALRHVNEPPPDVLERRPDCPPRVAMAIERAMAKRPEDRFRSMDELVAELEACLADLDPSSEEATMISRRPVRPAKPEDRSPVADPGRSCGHRSRSAGRLRSNRAPRRRRRVAGGRNERANPTLRNRRVRPGRRRRRTRRRRAERDRRQPRDLLDDRDVQRLLEHQAGRRARARCGQGRGAEVDHREHGHPRLHRRDS